MSIITRQVWVVIFHFNRGHVQRELFHNKAQAQEAIRVAVFNNEDCINFSCYREDVTLSDNATVEHMLDTLNRIIAKY